MHDCCYADCDGTNSADATFCRKCQRIIPPESTQDWVSKSSWSASNYYQVYRHSHDGKVAEAIVTGYHGWTHPWKVSLRVNGRIIEVRQASQTYESGSRRSIDPKKWYSRELTVMGEGFAARICFSNSLDPAKLTCDWCPM